MAGERVQSETVPHQTVQCVEALPHVARRRAQVYSHAGRQVDHSRSRNTVSTVRRVFASTPVNIRSSSPSGRTNSKPAVAFPERASGGTSTIANFTRGRRAKRRRQL